MEATLFYFLKVNVALVLFYAFYRLLFTRDTFFGIRRALLNLFWILAFAYPFLDNITWMVSEPHPVLEAAVQNYVAWLPEVIVQSEGNRELFAWPLWMILYGGVTGLLFLRYSIGRNSSSGIYFYTKRDKWCTRAIAFHAFRPFLLLRLDIHSPRSAFGERTGRDFDSRGYPCTRRAFVGYLALGTYYVPLLGKSVRLAFKTRGTIQFGVLGGCFGPSRRVRWKDLSIPSFGIGIS